MKLLRYLFKIPKWEHRVSSPTILAYWRQKARVDFWAGFAALFAVPFAVLRAQRQTLNDVDSVTIERYLQILHELPRKGIWRLRKNQQWLETSDEPFLPAGLYEPDIKRVYDRFGWKIAAIWWLWRNRAYGHAMRERLQDVRQLRYVPSGNGRMEPFTPGEWFCEVYNEAGILVGFEYSYTWKSWFGRHGQYRAGWAIRRFADASIGQDTWPADGQLTADGRLIETIRPFQTAR